MNKADRLKGGLSNLLGGSEPQPQPQPKGAPEPKGEPKGDSSATSLEETLEDEELRAKLHAKRMRGRGRPRTATNEQGKRIDGYSRTTFILRDSQLAKLREISFVESLTLKEIVEGVLDGYIAQYEATHGEVQPRPERYKGDFKKTIK